MVHVMNIQVFIKNYVNWAHWTRQINGYTLVMKTVPNFLYVIKARRRQNLRSCFQRVQLFLGSNYACGVLSRRVGENTKSIWGIPSSFKNGIFR